MVGGTETLDVARCRELGFGTGITSTGAGSFVAVDDTQLLARIGAAGAVATRALVADFVGEIGRNGVLVVRRVAGRAGRRQFSAGVSSGMMPVP
ncbi:hypothetical protein [Herbiconiux sp. YIM B11900]|uniref:hypothetical protein n=1 Tax=Herbiconiux sp. YIM B11900 TaxID=3404131 RepID=UPI003F8622DB